VWGDTEFVPESGKKSNRSLLWSLGAESEHERRGNHPLMNQRTPYLERIRVKCTPKGMGKGDLGPDEGEAADVGKGV